jgi:hypothetical protein
MCLYNILRTNNRKKAKNSNSIIYYLFPESTAIRPIIIKIILYNFVRSGKWQFRICPVQTNMVSLKGQGSKLTESNGNAAAVV